MRRKQIIGGMVFIGISILWVILFTYILPKPKPPTEGIQHNYYYPDEDVMWITSDGDTIWE